MGMMLGTWLDCAWKVHGHCRAYRDVLESGIDMSGRCLWSTSMFIHWPLWCQDVRVPMWPACRYRVVPWDYAIWRQ